MSKNKAEWILFLEEMRLQVSVQVPPLLIIT